MVLVLIAALGAALVPADPVKAATTIYVPDDYSTIQAAVNNVTAGDTIIVRAGTYNEAVNVNKDNLTIRGVGRDTVIVDGTGLGNAIGFNVVGGGGSHIQGVTIEEFTIRNYNGHGIDVRGDENTITGNCIRDNQGSGIFVYGNRTTISNNVVTGNDEHGICAYYNDNTISDNEVRGNSSHGIRFAGNNNCIRDNTVSGNSGAGIEFC